jgi:hypothetical protein
MAHVAKRHWLAGRLLLLGHSVVLSMKEKAGWASDRVALNDRAVPRDGGVMLVTCWSGYAPKKRAQPRGLRSVTVRPSTGGLGGWEWPDAISKYVDARWFPHTVICPSRKTTLL